MECIMFAPRRGVFYKREMVLLWCVCVSVACCLLFCSVLTFSAQFCCCLCFLWVCLCKFLSSTINNTIVFLVLLAITCFSFSFVCFFFFVADLTLSLATQQSARAENNALFLKKGWTTTNFFKSLLKHFFKLCVSVW